MKYNRHKFHAVQTIRDGMKFPSKKEARYYDFLKLEQKEGRVVGFFMQVPLHLPGRVIYRMDFLVFYSSGDCEGIEVKGYETPEWKIKKKLIDQLYPWFTLRIV